MCNYRDKLKRAVQLFDDADAILVFSGAGMAYSAGLHTYESLLRGEFGYFANKYMLTDVNEGFVLTAGEDRRAFFALYARVFHDCRACESHKRLMELIRRKPYFIAQTNPDYVYEKSGANRKNVIHLAGYPHYLQCADACNNDLLPMPRESEPFPACPVCGGKMRPFLDIFGDDNFICPKSYIDELAAYSNFVAKYREKRLLVIELECGSHDHFGFNAPVIIHALANSDNIRVISINKYEEHDGKNGRYICFHEPADKVIADILEKRPSQKRGRPSVLSKIMAARNEHILR